MNKEEAKKQASAYKHLKGFKYALKYSKLRRECFVEDVNYAFITANLAEFEVRVELKPIDERTKFSEELSFFLDNYIQTY